MKVEAADLDSPSLLVFMVSVDVQKPLNPSFIRAQELCESRGGRPGPPSLLFFMVSVNAKQH